MGALEGIEHVVVLMLENRSFDCMLGRLYQPKDPSFEGLTGNETNAWLSAPVRVWPNSDPGIPLTATDAEATVPTPDPGEYFNDMDTQLFDAAPRSAVPPPMSGFVANYMAQIPTPPDCRAVMHCFWPSQVPVISTLAKAFGVCDQWYASAPCQTWPNRFFVHTGTSLGYVNNHDFPFPFRAPSIFSRLGQNGNTWRLYFHDAPQAILLRDIWLEALFHFRFFSTFLADAANGTLPNYSFIEPHYFTDLFLNRTPNDEHPPSNVYYGEQLIAAVYNAVRASPCWKKTLLVITYDEHGGCFDHMPPPRAVSPDGKVANDQGFSFDTYGVRVPAVIVSPYIPPGSKVRVVPTGIPFNGPPYPFDHTSIIKTLRILFNLGGPLTARDDCAPDLLTPLSLLNPDNDGPASVSIALVKPPIRDLLAGANAAPNSMQSALARMAAQLPTEPLSSGAAAPESVPLTAPAPPTVALAHARATAQVKAFLGVED